MQQHSPLRNLIVANSLLLTGWIVSGASFAADQPIFKITCNPEISTEPYSGRVYIFFARGESQPRFGPNWFRPEPFLSLDVENWQTEKPLKFSTQDSDVLTYPKDFADLDLTEFNAQAVVRFNPLERRIGLGTGNGFSSVVKVGDQKQIELRVDEIVKPRDPPQLQLSTVISVRSKLLSEFHHRHVDMHATVTVPETYAANEEHKYPVIYEIPGFGGTHIDGRAGRNRVVRNRQGVDFIRVLLDPSCPLGHHVFANSANNGPCGDALTQELIPWIEQHFRVDCRPNARFLTGHSSGGWSSLWLQVSYPEFFGGTWSTSPDPVDFRDFQKINLYRQNENMHRYPNGARRPLARRGQDVAIWYEDFDWMEHVLGPGGQLHSFEAAFSPRGNDGLPVRLWNRETGEIDPAVAETWQKYDIQKILRSNWQNLEPKLRGKLHVFMGDTDTFYLEGATFLLKETLAELGSDAEVTILPGRDHMNLYSGGLRGQIEEEIAEQYLRHLVQ